MPNDQTLNVSIDELHHARQHVLQIADEMKDGVTGLSHRVDDLLGEWLGVAGSAYGPPWDKWRSGADDVLHALAQSADALSNAAQAYAKQEAQNSSRIGSAGNALEAAPVRTGLNLDV